MIIRKAEPSDIPRIEEIFAEARGTIAALGIDQWQDGYPTREIATEDALIGRSYVVELDGAVSATYVLQTGGDRTSDEIATGAWPTGNTDADYLAVHRVAIAVSCRGRGVAGEIVSYSADFAREHGLKSLRIDTHEGNVVMRRMLEKNGFSYCGVIHLANGDPRVAYERIV